MFRSLLNSLHKSLIPQAQTPRRRKNRSQRPRTLRLESLEGRELCTANQATTASTPASGKPIEGIVWTAPINFHAHYTNHKPKLSDFSVTVEWGDGKKDVVNNIQVNPNDKSQYPTEYIGSIDHTYLEDGPQKSKFRVIVTNKTDKLTWDATAYNMVVSDAPIRGQAVTMQASTDKPFSNIVAWFRDDNPNASMTEYTTKKGGATIVWKDGSNETSKGTIQKVGSQFVVYGTHSFKRNGIFEVQVNISDDNGSTTTVYSTANVTPHFTTVKPTITDSGSGATATRTAVWGGLKISGSPADVQEFSEMLDGAVSRSPSLKALMDQIVSDTRHPVVVKAARNPAKVFGDDFPSNLVDLVDLEAFPVTVPRGAYDVTQGEIVAHIMAERYAGATNENPTSNYTNAFHPAGIVAGNKFRQEAFGQVGVTKIWGTVLTRDRAVETFYFSDGWHQDVYVNPNFDILIVDMPVL